MIFTEEAGAAATEMALPQYAAARISVWWDIENCPVPNNVEALGIVRNINLALVKMNYFGPVSISAYGDTTRIPSFVQRILSSTGVALNHVPSELKDISDKKILVDMLLWAVDNPAPATLMLISGERDFSNALHQLSRRKYNVLLAQPQKASTPIIAAAKMVWLWTSLAAGGHPLTRGESSGLIADGCYASDSETLYHSVSGRAVSRSMLSLDSENGRIDDSENRGDYTLFSTNQFVQLDIIRNKLPSIGGTSGFVRVCALCNVVCYSLETFSAHLSGKRHTAQVTLVLSGEAGPFIALVRAQVCGSTKPIKKPKLVKPVWCSICQISCNSTVVYANHVLGQKHQMNLELKLGKAKNISKETTEEDVETKKKKVIEGGADPGAVRVCGLCSVVCNSQIVFESHLRGLKHTAMVKNQAAGA